MMTTMTPTMTMTMPSKTLLFPRGPTIKMATKNLPIHTNDDHRDDGDDDGVDDQICQLAPLIIDTNQQQQQKKKKKKKKKRKTSLRRGDCRESGNNDNNIVAVYNRNVRIIQEEVQCRTALKERRSRNMIYHRHFEEIRNSLLNEKKKSTTMSKMAVTKSRTIDRRRSRRRFIGRTWGRQLLLLLILPFMAFLLFVVVGGESSSPSSPPSSSSSLSRSHPTQRGTRDHISNNSSGGSNSAPTPAPTEKGIVRIVEHEIWDPSTNEWKGQTPRWTSTTSTGTGSDGHQQHQQSSSLSSSPADFHPPDGWKFKGDWKIVVNQNQSKKDDISSGGGGGGGDSAAGQSPTATASPATDAMGWEYIYQYLRPPKRRRVWLRTIVEQQVARKKMDERKEVQEETPIKKQPPGSATDKGVPSKMLEDQRSDKLLKRRPPDSGGVPTPSAVRKISPLFLQADIIRSLRDDFNFKGLGMSLYKSLIFPKSFGYGVRLPLTANFDVFDRNPGLPSVASTLSFWGPSWTIIAGLSCSVTVEWIKWIIRSAVWSIPRAVVLVWYRLVMPLLLALKTTLEGLIRPVHRNSQKQDADKSTSTSKSASASVIIPSNIQNFLSTRVSRPMYNSELSERVGCSVSYRWSQKYGFEFRVSYWHSYLPTLLLYRRLISQVQQHDVVQKFVSPTKQQHPNQQQSSADTDSDDAYKSSSSSSKNNIDWWRKHFASVGIGTSYPTRDPPHISCNTQLSLSGFNFEGMGLKRKQSMASTSDKKVLGRPILDNIEKNVDLVSSAKAVIADKMREGVESSDDRQQIHQGKNGKKMSFETIS